MQDTIFGLLLLGTTTGVIPAVIAIILFQFLCWFVKGLQKSLKVLGEKEPPPKPKARNIRAEIWDERDGDMIDQYLQEREDAK